MNSKMKGSRALGNTSTDFGKMKVEVVLERLFLKGRKEGATA